ncbi:unnamed protein product [Brassica oleracea]|uniref:Uncharacterized protein n=1 Tax=Brassica oleracea TaxID=3712 RepID=A0A3P6EB32_BRAOL|nr:unnamed protein product [Brassica oleracea]
MCVLSKKKKKSFDAANLLSLLFYLELRNLDLKCVSSCTGILSVLLVVVFPLYVVSLR